MIPPYRGWTALAVAFFACSINHAATLVVDPGGGGDHTDIQSAVDAAKDGDTVIVKAGVYITAEPIDFNRMVDPEDPESPALKDIVVRSETGPAETIVRMADPPDDPLRASVFIFENGEGEGSVLEGFTITGGRGTFATSDTGSRIAGGGILCLGGASPRLVDCTVTENSAILGGGISCAGGASPSIEGCRISRNSAVNSWGGGGSGGGGGISCAEDSSPAIRECLIEDNEGQRGGGIYCLLGSSPTVDLCTIAGNRGVRSGGGLFSSDGTPTVTDCAIRGNEAGERGGGGVFCGENSSIHLTDCRIVRNRATQNGGGVRCAALSSPAILRCLIAGNEADAGGGISCRDTSAVVDDCTIAANAAAAGGGVECDAAATPSLVHCTILDNRATEGGALRCAESSSPSLLSCIVWGNGDDAISNGPDAVPRIAFSCVESAEIWPGEGNIDLDPLFCGWRAPDVHVDPSSPDPGDGSADHPFPGLSGWLEEIAHSAALIAGSPCLGTGDGGSDMGADGGTCDGAGESSVVVHLAAGTYDASELVLAGGVSVQGAGIEETTLEGRVWGLRTGARLSRLSVTGGDEAGIAVGGGEAPEIEDVAIAWNGGDGVSCGPAAAPSLTHCTIAWNRGVAVRCDIGSSPTVADSILWGNLEGSFFAFEGDPGPEVNRSCIEGDGIWPGAENTNEDPLFCGWTVRPEVFVNPANPVPGDGTEADPFSDIRSILTLRGFSLALSEGSPCLGRGEGGTNIGADAGTCAGDGKPSLLVHLAPGSYEIGGSSPIHGVELEGDDRETTILVGPLPPLRTGDSLSRLTVTGSPGSTVAGITVAAGGMPEIREVTVTASAWGVDCLAGAAPSLFDCTIARNDGAGITCREGSVPAIDHCTIVANLGSGVSCEPDAEPQLTNSIVWDNVGGSFSLDAGAPEVSHSCIDGAGVWPGPQNINDDPRFCGWETGGEIFVDASSPDGGDGSQAQPFSHLSSAADDAGYRIALASDSPCIGTGEGGTNRGADTGICGAGGASVRTIQVAAGTYSLAEFRPRHRVRILGAGADETILSGDLPRFRTGELVSDVTVRGRMRARGDEGPAFLRVLFSAGVSAEVSDVGVSCEDDASPRLTDCEISGHGRLGIDCRDASAPLLTNCVIRANRSGGLSCVDLASPSLVNCTITENGGGGMTCDGHSSPSLTNCIVWDNDGGALWADGDSEPRVSYSCIEGPDVWPGAGNTRDDPQFCGWRGPAEIHVDRTATEPFDGSAGNPYPDIDFAVSAMGFDLSLSAASPCIGTGQGGADMGADTGRGGATARPSLLIHVAAGTYEVGPLDLIHKVSIVGSGREETSLTGEVSGLRTGALLSSVQVKGWNSPGITVGRGEAPLIEATTIDEGDACGVFCLNGAGPTLRDCTISENQEGGILCIGTSAPTVRDCVISANLQGGIICSDEASPAVEGCSITGHALAGVSCAGGSAPHLTRCIIRENQTAGMTSTDTSSPVLTDCLLLANAGPGLSCDAEAMPSLANCTITENTDGGLACGGASSPVLVNCIVWDNLGGAVRTADASDPDISYSCIESDEVWPGLGNIDDSPLFCGWGALAEIHVDASNPAPGDGSAANPYSDLSSALAPGEFDLALSTGSPCIGTGQGGADMGADTGRCDSTAPARCVVYLAEGTYAIDALHLAHRVSVEGAGAEHTVIEGTLSGLRTGETLSGVTITSGTGAGIIASRGEAPEILRSRVAGCEAEGILCPDGAIPIVRECEITGNAKEGLVCIGSAAPQVIDCTFSSNSVAAIQCRDMSAPVLDGCAIVENLKIGIICRDESAPRLTRCAILENGTTGVACSHSSSPTLDHCTIAWNGFGWNALGGKPAGLVANSGTAPTLSSCIVWDNATESTVTYEGAAVTVRYSCIEGETPWPGTGNIRSDPLFCGWGPQEEVHVDAGHPDPGDGSPDHPFGDLLAALTFDMGISSRSPCAGTAEGGTDMGAGTVTCDASPVAVRLIRLAEGTYRIGERNLLHPVSIEGAGEGLSVVEGTLRGPRTGTTISHLTVTGGRASGIVVLVGEAPEFHHVTITGNSAEKGGGISCAGKSSPVLTECTIAGNTAQIGGGFYFAEGSSPTVVDCTISGNATAWSGGGGEIYGGVLRRCRITGNVASWMGGGVSCGRTAVLEDCLISGNALYGSQATGGGVKCGWGTIYDSNTGAGGTLINCTIAGNFSPDWGGGVSCWGSATTLINCAILGNRTDWRGGGVYCRHANPKILTNCTIVGNAPSGVDCEFDSGADVTNSIIWDNDARGIYADSTSSPTAIYSCIQGDPVWPGEGNRNEDPRFVRKGEFVFDRFKTVEIAGQTYQLPDFIVDLGDVRLGPDSPAIDAGTCPAAPGFDIEGKVRPAGAGCDMGVYEYRSTADAPFFMRGEANADGRLDLGDMVFILNYLFASGRAPTCLKTADVNDDGINDIGDAIFGLNYLFANGPSPPPPIGVCGMDRTADDLSCVEYKPCM